MQQRDGVGAIQQHQDILKAVDTRRRARHDQLNALGYSQLVEGFNNVAVSSSPRRWNGHQQQASSSNGSSRGYSNGAMNNSNHHHYNGQNSGRSRPSQGGRGGGSGNGVGRGGFAGPKGKGKEKVLTPTGDIIAANEDPEDEKRKKELKIQAFGDVYDPHEETLRNDLSQNYLNTGRRPQNMLQGVDLDQRFKEYPKLEKLLKLHSDLVQQHAHPATYLKADLESVQLTELLPTKFDSILIDPPLEEYARDYPARVGGKKPYWTWDEIAALPVPSIAANPGFIWLWVGSGKADSNGISGLDKGRDLLAKWGYRRCEDIVWLKTNKKKPDLAAEPPTRTVLTHTKEHCLMGIRGTVRRSTDGHFVHCNVDTDVIVWEANEDDPLRKPPELYNLIENFCLGTRRLELFGKAHNARAGWLTVGDDDLPTTAIKSDKDAGTAETTTEGASVSQAVTAYDKEVHDRYFVAEAEQSGGNLVPTTEEVENLRPRSPGGNKPAGPLVPGLKSNPQGIGRHTNRAGTPSASQALEYERLQAQFQEQVLRQQQQQAQLEMERQRQEEMMLQQQMMMQQMAMMGMPAGMGMGMTGFQQGFPPQGQMAMNGQWQMPMGMNMNMGMQSPPPNMPGGSPMHMQGQYNPQVQYPQQQQQQQGQGQYNPAMNGMFPGYNFGPQQFF